jgi:hypothetical protein
MLLAWTTRALFESGSSTTPWNQEDATSSNATDYFFNDIIGMNTLVKEDGNVPTRLVGPNVGYSLLQFAIIFICLAHGALFYNCIIENVIIA